jgi:hypothetical protein
MTSSGIEPTSFQLVELSASTTTLPRACSLARVFSSAILERNLQQSVFENMRKLALIDTKNKSVINVNGGSH